MTLGGLQLATCKLKVSQPREKEWGGGGVCSGLKRVFGHVYPGKEENWMWTR